MAGRAIRTKMIKAIENAGGDEALLELIASGRSIAALAEDIGTTRPMLSTYLNRDADAVERLARARETAAHTYAEEAVTISDQAVQGVDDKVAKLRASTRQWLASRLNRAAYGDSPTVQIGINVGQLHLDALRRVNANPPPNPHVTAAQTAIEPVND